MIMELTRRAFLGNTGLGAAALTWMMNGSLQAQIARARRVIFLFQFGGPSQFELFDPKTELHRHDGADLPTTILGQGPISGLSRDQARLPVVAPRVRFARHGQSGLPFSDLVPHMAGIADDLCFLRSVTTDAVAHDPALSFMQTGSALGEKPSSGAWISYGLGSESRNLPAFVVLQSNGRGDRDTQPLGSRLWGSGFLPSCHQGVQFRSNGDPVLFLSNPPGIDGAKRRSMLDAVSQLNGLQAGEVGDPEIRTRTEQYELAFRMQTSVPELLDVRSEVDEVFELYGPDARRPGTYAANCLLARRLAERGVRFIQLFHRGWDQHGDLPKMIRLQCEDTDRASAALVRDLKRRGMLDDTLIVWGGEFGRTAYCQGKMTQETYGRDHHGRCFTMWLAGGGVKGGVELGETDDFGFNVAKDPIPVRDLHATMLHLLGLDPERLTYKFQGLDQRLTGVEKAHIIRSILA
jgi:hypothetical protein